jgi:tetratricopeptide (TPR) repeat protein
MPFIKKNHAQDARPSSPFIGRAGEILFFVHNILQPDTPTHNILSISGQGGVGKTTLLIRFIAEAHETPFKDYCLTAIIDERQATPVSIMEKFAQQLHLTGEFAKTLKQYKEVLRRQQVERETFYNALFEGAPDIAGAVVEGIPVAGPLLREGAKVVTKHLLKENQAFQLPPNAKFSEPPLYDLTGAFVTELNRIADAKVTLGSIRKKRQRRIVLFFDTFEQLAAETTPWLLDHFLDAQVSSNVVLVVTGRDPIERTSPDDPKRWLPYCNDGTISWISLNSFTEDETRRYLVKRGIIDEGQMVIIWHLSQGLPLYLGLLTSNPNGDIDPTKDVVVNFLRWIPEKERIKRQLALDAALLSRPFNQDDLEIFSYVPESDRASLYQWLTEQPFVRSRPQDGRYLYHDVARGLFSRHLYQRSPKEADAIRRALATYYQKLLEKIQAERGKEAYNSEEWLELLLAAVSQLLLLPDQASHVRAIEHVLHAYDGHTNKEQDAAIARSLHDLPQEPPPHSISPATQLVAIQLLHYVEADRYSQQWLAAADALLERVMHVPSFPSKLLAGIYWWRARVYNNLDTQLFNRELATKNFQQALKLFESTNYYQRGFAYFYCGNYQEALASHNQALEHNPQDIDAYFGRGWAYHRLGEYHQAIADLEHVRELDPNYNNPGGLYNGLRYAYYGAGKYQQALSMNDRLDPNPSAYIFRSKCYISLKQYRRAIEECNHALEALGPTPKKATTYYQSNLGSAYYQRGLAYLWLRDIQQAQADFTRSYGLEPGGMCALLLAEWTELCQEGADPSVSERLKAIVTVDQPNYASHTCQGIALLLCRNFKEALAELEQALLSNRNDRWKAYFWKGVACAFLEQDEEAITVIEKALDSELPPILLAPLRWFEQERPDFYEKHVVPLLAKHK